MSSSSKWHGPGLFAFLGLGARSPELPEASVPVRSTPRRIQGIYELLAGSGGRRPSELERVAIEFLENGGTSCILLEGPASAGGRAAGLGEEGGPGQGSGLHALTDLEEVGAVVVAGRLSPRDRGAVLALADRRRDLLFFLEEEQRAGGPGGEGVEPRLLSLRPNAAVLRWPAASSESEAGRELGKLAGYLEASDFRFQEEFRNARANPPAWLEMSDAIKLQAWRRRAGLLRSVDLGTRWVLFELQHPLLWRKVEREVRAFLRQLEQRGFLAPGEGLSADSVECSGESGEGVAIHVRARLSDPFGSALAEVPT
jgi:hypothetical protein